MMRHRSPKSTVMMTIMGTKLSTGPWTRIRASSDDGDDLGLV